MGPRNVLAGDRGQGLNLGAAACGGTQEDEEAAARTVAYYLERVLVYTLSYFFSVFLILVASAEFGWLRGA